MKVIPLENDWNPVESCMPPNGCFLVTVENPIFEGGHFFRRTDKAGYDGNEWYLKYQTNGNDKIIAWRYIPDPYDPDGKNK